MGLKSHCGDQERCGSAGRRFQGTRADHHADHHLPSRKTSLVSRACRSVRPPRSWRDRTRASESLGAW